MQNTREFQGLILIMLILQRLRINNCNITWIGDNVSALSWTQRMVVKSTLCFKSYCIYCWLTSISKMVVETKHISGELMQQLEVDALSRGQPTPLLNSSKGISLSDTLERDQHITNMLAM